MDSLDLVKMIKKAAIEAVNASKPSDIVFGVVISLNPLKIQIDQKLTLGSAQLVVSEHLTDHVVNIRIDDEWETEEAEVGDTEHHHEIKGNKKMLIKGSLELEDRVIMLRCSGGQQYIVIDRIGG